MRLEIGHARRRRVPGEKNLVIAVDGVYPFLKRADRVRACHGPGMSVVAKGDWQ